MAEADLKHHEMQALLFLAHGPDTMGRIDSDEKLAAALVFAKLHKRGNVQLDRSAQRCLVSLSDQGVETVVRHQEEPQPRQMMMH